MFKIYDGREHFYQWDTNVKLIVEDPSIIEVHFCNRTDNCSLVCETYVEDGLTLVNVPNILLQTDWKIRVYAYDGSLTKHDECYEVKSRTKPADYAYEETEVLTWHTISEKVDTTIAEVNAAEEARATAENARIEAETARKEDYTRLRADLEGTAREASVLVEILETNIEDAEAATEAAVNAATYANSIAAFAQQSAEYAIGATGAAENATYEASQATIRANEATEAAAIAAGTAVKATDAAMKATEDANAATGAANEAAARANEAAAILEEETANALKGNVKGAGIVAMKDTSPIEHNIKCVASGLEDMSTVTIKKYGKNLLAFKAPGKYSFDSGTGYAYVREDDSIYIEKVVNNNTHVVNAQPISKMTVMQDGKYIFTEKGRIKDTLYMVLALNRDGKTEYINNRLSANSNITTQVDLKAGDKITFYLQITDGKTVENVEYYAQLELGTTATEFTSYINPISYPVNADGVVEGITSLYPGTTLIANTPGVEIECEYNRDINKAFAELQQALISLGGNI